MFSPLHNHIMRRSSKDGYTEEYMFRQVHNETATLSQLRSICHYLLRIMFPSAYAKWRLDNGYCLPDAVDNV